MSAKITGEEATVAMPLTPGGPNIPVASPSEKSFSTSGSARHVFAGRYEVLGLVGAGGMGTVYRVRDTELDEIVALKLLQRAVVDQPGMLERFRAEVKLARRVTHKNVARTFDIGEYEGEKFLTMEFVEGESLAARIARTGGIVRKDGVPLIEGICAGLDAAHAAGVVHRDLKPDNILLANDGRVVITDFGIARALSGGVALTMGMAIGTPAYMAPELIEGRRDLDARADIYALGAILYECITGEPAWKGDNVWAVAAARLIQPPPEVREKNSLVPQALSDIIKKCMARDREQRFATAAEMFAAVKALDLPFDIGEKRSELGMKEPKEDTKSVAVLPFKNRGAADAAYLADGVYEDVIDSLSMAPGLRVLSRGSVERFRDVDRDAREVGRELRVHVVVEGSVRRAGSQLRVSARLVSVADGFQLWAKRFDRPEAEALEVSDEVASAIAEALTVRRGVERRFGPIDPRTVDLYLRARQIYHRGWHHDAGQAVVLFEQALALAPDDPLILAGLSRALVKEFMFDMGKVGAEEVSERARHAAERAIAVAPSLGEARAALAHLEWALANAEACARQLREALRLAPSSLELNELYGRVLVELGELDRGITRLERVVSLDPSLRLSREDLLRARVLSGDWSPFEAQLEAPPDGDSSSDGFILTRLSLWRRDPSLAKVLRARTVQHRVDIPRIEKNALELLETGRIPADMEQVIEGAGIQVHAARRRAFIYQFATEALVYAGQDDRATETLARADAAGLIDLGWIDRCPLLASLREKPAFRDTRDHVAARAKAALDVLDGRRA